MTYDRRPDRRSGGRPGSGRPAGGGRPGGGRPDRPPRDRDGFSGQPPRDRAGYGQRPPERGGFDRPPQDRPAFDRPHQDRPGFAPRGRDDGGMSIRLDPRRLAALKLLAAEAGVRPGELVTSWVEERLDAARSGAPASAGQAAGPAAGALEAVNARIDELTRRLDALGHPGAPAPALAEEPEGAVDEAAPSKRRGRPPKAGARAAAKAGKTAPSVPRVPLHEEIAAIITERGPQTAGELAVAIVERGRYTAPRTAKRLDAATVSARVSNPVYRSRFVRSKGRISLATPE